MSRLLAIGDIHGSLSLLEQLLGYIRPTSADRLVFLGDYIDRGPDSCGVIDRLLVLARQFPDTVFLRGNHDQLMLDALAEWGTLPGWPRLRDRSPRYYARSSASDSTIWLLNGGVQALASYGIPLAADPTQTDISAIPAEHLRFLRETCLWWQTEQFLFVHAGTDPHQPLQNQDPYTLLWDRSSPQPRDDGLLQIVGHTPTSDSLPAQEPGRLCIDTGACYGRALTCVEVRTQTIWQALGD